MSTDEQLQQHLDNDPQKPINSVSAYLTLTLPDYLWNHMVPPTNSKT
jgi:hypothetical protein